MKIMSRDFTPREKGLLLVLALVLLAASYYLLVDQPVRSAVGEAKTQQEELNTELMLLQAKANALSRMQNEMDTMDALGNLGAMGSYNNSKAELEELNQILKAASTYDISFEDVTRDGNLIRRGFHLTFTAPDYETAADMVKQLCAGEWRCLISDLRYGAAESGNLEKGKVSVGLTAAFYETMEGGTADSGLPE